MLIFGSPLRSEKIVPSIRFQHMRSFDPDRLAGYVRPSVDENPLLAEKNLVCSIELPHSDRPVSLVQGLVAGGNTIVQKKRPAIVIEEERGINAIHSGKPHRIGPGTLRPYRCRNEIAADIDKCAGDVEDSLLEPDGGRKQTSRDSLAFEVQDFRTFEHMADNIPVDEIPAVENADPGIIRKRRIDEIVVFADAADAWIRVETREDRVAEFLPVLSKGGTHSECEGEQNGRRTH